ncbi:MAG: hypothetical protein LAQ69_20160 [Acidobacteriia bacterium]|nr:hypothetical protein [Terriglobia bacterium]
MLKILLSLGICAGVLSAQEVPPLDGPAPAPKLWRASITALAVANVMDVHSSWGKHELNSTLSGPSGNFGKEGALIKLGFQGGLIGLEYLVTRGHPTRKLYRALSVINFGASAAIGATAIHNYTIPQVR